jgi:sugar phosphate isomerase/epimerase
MQRDWLVSSADEASRQQGVAIIEKSIDLAHQLSAPVVVIHCGSILTSSDHESKLRALFNAGQVGSAEFRQIKNDFQHLRQDLINLHLQPVKKSLGELIEYAVHRGISLGLENRYHYMDIPNPDEMEQLLGLAAPHQLGFIFDVGHAQALDRLGFYPHAEWLHRFALRMLGCHLHDVIGITDHLAPGLGEIDFASIAHFLPGKTFRTCELSPGNTLAQVKEGLGVLIESGCIKHLQ